MIAKLTRYYSSSSVWGELNFPGKTLYTVERAWEDNAPFISCIPEGIYQVSKHQSPKFGECFILEGDTVGRFEDDGKERSHILIHAANFSHQLQGCIAPGNAITSINGESGANSSKPALNWMLKNLPDVWELEITS